MYRKQDSLKMKEEAMEELIDQLEAFTQSFVGGLLFLGAASASALFSYIHTRRGNIKLALYDIPPGVMITLWLLSWGHTAFGVLATVAQALAIAGLVVRARSAKQEERAPLPTPSLSQSRWMAMTGLGVMMAVLVWGILWAAGYPLVAFFFAGVGLISYLLWLVIVVWKQRVAKR